MEKYASNNSSNNEAIAQDKLDDAQDKLEKKDNRREGSVQCLYGNGRQNWWQDFVWALYVPTCMDETDQRGNTWLIHNDK